MQRVQLIEASGIKSSYSKKNKPKEKLDISCFNSAGQRGNFVCSDMFEALKQLDKLVSINKGQLLITDLFRSWDVQAKNREDYESGKKKAFVAKPGGSFHNAGRAVDISVNELNFEGKEKGEWLKFFWGLAKPLGFYPIITLPDLGISECWHYDYPGKTWEKQYLKLDYAEVAKCATLDIGEWDPKVSPDKTKIMFLQSQLIRLQHYGIGKVDGILGPKTLKILKEITTSNDLDFQIAELLHVG
jgi:hypothetical protein